MSANTLTGGWTRRLVTVVFVASCTWAAVYHACVEIVPYDDAYITYRYADRLVAGKGLTYNDGERVFGSSSPLYAIWLAALQLGAPTVETPALSVRGNLVLFLASAIAATAAGAAIAGSSTVGFAAGSLFAANRFLLHLSVGGMETFLFLSLMLGTIWASSAGRWPIAALLAGLSATARPEGLLVMPVVALAWWVAGGARPVRFLGLLSGPLLIWAGVATAYYGTPVPHSITAKMSPVYPLEAGHAFLTMLKWFGRWTAPAVFSEPARLRDVTALLIAEGAALGVLVSAGVRQRGGWMVPVLLNLFVGLYAVTNPMLFQWYAAPVRTLWLLAFVLGPFSIGERLSSGRGATPRLRPLIVAGAGLFLVAGTVLPYVADLRHGRSPIEAEWSGERLRIFAYRDAARCVTGIAPSSATGAAPEIGAFGYYWHGNVLDACGLVSPQALPFLPVPEAERGEPWWGVIPAGLIRTARPEYVATLDRLARRGLFAAEWFPRSYEPLREIALPQPIWKSDAVLLFRRMKPESP